MSEHLLIDSALDKLIHLGRPPEPSNVWADYSALGVTAEHIPDLIRILMDRSFWELEDDQRVYAPIHAWRALGALKAQEALEPLLEFLLDADELDCDWIYEDFEALMTALGPTAIPRLTECLHRKVENEYARTTCSRALAALARHHPEHRDEVVRTLGKELEEAELNDRYVNASVINDLVELDAKEAAPVIERAFAEGLVDTLMRGGWADVRYDLGLGPKPPERRRSTFFDPFGAPTPAARAKLRSKDRRREKKKQRQARRQNRR